MHRSLLCVGTDFTIMTLSTVGFGDISPSPNGGMRIFVAFYALVSCGIVFPLLARLFGDLLTRYSEMVCILYPITLSRTLTLT